MLLLGKSLNKDRTAPRGRLLKEHLEECLASAKFLFDDLGWGQRLFNVMDLSRFGITYPEFRKAVFLSVLLHDLGKAGDEFQKAIQSADKDKFYPQAYRHELLSYVLLLHEPLRSWLNGLTQHSDLVRWSVFGHHVKYDKAMPYSPFAGDEVPVYLKDLSQDLIRLSSEYLGVEFPALQDRNMPLMDLKIACEGASSYPDSPVSAAIKWSTMISDVLGSMTPKEGGWEGFRSQLFEELQEALAPSETNYGARALKKLNKLSFDECTLRDFQIEARDTPGSILVQVACGGGKTVSVLLWADQCRNLRLVVSTPTTGTATALFHDYGLKDDKEKHTREFLELVLANNGTPPKKGDEAEQESEAHVLQSYKDIVAGVVFCTADQVLGCLSFNKRSILWLLRLVDSQIVFDEAHAYDETMSGWHRKFLEWFPGIRVAVMSATLKHHQIQYLTSGRALTRITDRSKSSPADLKRYCIHVVTRRVAEQQFKPGSLWVANTRPDVQELAGQFLMAHVLHSSMKYGLRKRLQEMLIQQGFDRPGVRNPNPQMVIATQLAEMSLDLSCRNLISAIAPIYAMIQRLGRLARFLTGAGDPWYQVDGHAYFYMPEAGYPYEMSEKSWLVKFELYRDWLIQFDGQWVSQRELESAYLADKSLDPIKPIYSPESSVGRAKRLSLRNVIGSVTGILEDDAKLLGTKPPLYKVQEVEIPAYLNEVEYLATTKFEPIHGRVVFPKAFFDYDSRLGLIHRLRRGY